MPGLGAGHRGGKLTKPPKAKHKAKGKPSNIALEKVHAPFSVKKPSVSPGQAYGAYRAANGATAAHYHAGQDYGMPVGTKLYAMVDAKIVYAGDWAGGDHKLIQYKSKVDVGNIKKGDVFGYGCSGTHLKKVGDDVKAGEQIAISGSMYAGDGVHLNMQRGSINPGSDGNTDPTNAVNYAYGGTADTIDGSGTNDQSPGTGANIGMLATATAITGALQFPSIFSAAESQVLTGQRGMLNDQPLFDAIANTAQASLRDFMSLPNGKFYAFYPDYFGSLGKHAYWQIADIEVIDGRIDLSDDNLITHMFVVGDITSAPDGQVTAADRMQTGGVVTIFTAFTADFLNGAPSDTTAGNQKNKVAFNNRNEAINFLKKYGARPHYEEAPMVRAPVYEAFLAYQKFCLAWASQFKTNFELTFMPELYPGGIVAFPEHGLQCYVSEVSHNCDYTNGFTTTVTLMAPSAFKSEEAGVEINSDRSWVHAGMIRAIPNEDVENFATTTLPLKGNKGKWKPGQL